MTVIKLYFPDDPPIRIHQSRVQSVLYHSLQDFIGMEQKDQDQADHQSKYLNNWPPWEPRWKSILQPKSLIKLELEMSKQW